MQMLKMNGVIGDLQEAQLQNARLTKRINELEKDVAMRDAEVFRLQQANATGAKRFRRHKIEVGCVMAAMTLFGTILFLAQY